MHSSETLQAQELYKNLSYDITWEPIPDEWEDNLPENILKQKETIYHGINDNPEKYLDELIKLDREYPDCKAFSNYLVITYLLTGQQDMAIAQMKVNNRKYPDYLFAKLQLGQHYIAIKQFENLKELFDNKFDLKQIYPERDIFHITEVEGMLYVAAEWYNWCGDKEKFFFYYNILSELSPSNAGTKKLMFIALNNRFKHIKKDNVGNTEYSLTLT